MSAHRPHSACEPVFMAEMQCVHCWTHFSHICWHSSISGIPAQALAHSWHLAEHFSQASIHRSNTVSFIAFLVGKSASVERDVPQGRDPMEKSKKDSKVLSRRGKTFLRLPAKWEFHSLHREFRHRKRLLRTRRRGIVESRIPS